MFSENLFDNDCDVLSLKILIVICMLYYSQFLLVHGNLFLFSFLGYYNKELQFV